MPTNGGTSGGSESRSVRAEGANNIVPFGARVQRRLTQQMEFEQQRLKDLGAQASRAVDRQRALDDLKDLPNWIDGQLRSISRGSISRIRARQAASDKRAFERRNRDRVVRVPRGTTAQEYADIVARLAAGDRSAIEQFSRKR